MKHTAISGSNFNRVKNCTASALFVLDVEEEQSDYATEGQIAACVAEQEVRHRLGEAVDPCEGATPDMRSFANGYADYILQKASELDEPKILLEEYCEFIPGYGGTPDCAITSQDALVIIDYKYGVGVNVTAEDNDQLLWYANSLLTDSLLAGVDSKVILAIYQPRAIDGEVIKEVELSLDEILKWRSEAVKVIDRVEDRKVSFKMGNHCQFCPIYSACPEQNKQLVSLNKAFESPDKQLPDLELMTDEDLAKVLDKQDLVKKVSKYVESAKKLANARAKEGHEIPGWKLVKTRTTRRWDENKSEEIIKTIQEADINPYKPQQMKPFSAIEKEVGKKEFSEKYSGLLATSDSFGLAPESSPKEAVEIRGGYKVVSFLDGEI